MSKQLINAPFLEQLIQDIGAEMMPILLETFEPDAQKHIAIIAQSDPEDRQGLKDISFHGHAMKGMSASLGFTALSEIGAYLENYSEKILADSTDNVKIAEFRKNLSEINNLTPALLQQSIAEFQQWYSKL